MARNHQEWARHRSEYGPWDYPSNQAVIDRFFTEGMELAKDNEDLMGSSITNLLKINGLSLLLWAIVTNFAHSFRR